MTTRNAASMGSYGAEWTHRGYAGRGNVQPLLDVHAGRSGIVAGNAAGVFHEVADACRALGDPVIYAANDVGMYLPRVDHWCSLHEDKLPVWKAVRWGHVNRMEVTKYHGDDPRPFLDYAWEQLTPLFCLSGYFAMQLAWLMGCAPIVLCGCPGAPAPRFFEAAARPDFGYGSGTAGSDQGVQQQLLGEMDRLPDFKAAVRSMSGFTREVFGGL